MTVEITLASLQFLPGGLVNSPSESRDDPGSHFYTGGLDPNRESFSSGPSILNQAMMSVMGWPKSISSRLRPGTANLRGSRPSRCSTVAWASVT